MFRAIWSYIKVNPFIFAIAIQQVIAFLFYISVAPSPTRIKLGLLTLGYGICNFIMLSIK